MITAKIACIAMASGHSTRFGSNKLLASFQGRPLICHTLKTIAQLGLPTVVVTRYPEIETFAKELDLATVCHSQPYQNDTVRLGLEQLGAAYEGYMFCTCDQPFLEARTLLRLCEGFVHEPTYIHRLAHEGLPGNPVIFPVSLRKQLLTLPQDKGGSYLIRQYPQLVKLLDVENSWELFDIDTSAALELAEKYKRSV